MYNDNTSLGIWFVLLLLILSVARDQLLAFRIRKGYYGKTEYEAREIIGFILKHSKRIDFTDGGNLKEIISKDDITTLEQYVEAALSGVMRPKNWPG